MTQYGLLDPASMRSIASEIGLKPTKTRGQNFLHDGNTVRKIVAASGVGADDVVVEVGPGLGSLTLGLLDTGARVIAIEIDPVLAERLPVTIAQRMPEATDRLTVVTADALDVRQLPADPTAFVANLPYNVSVPVVLHLCEHFPSWKTALVMVQLEVAERLVAQPGSRVYGTPSVKLSWYADAERAGTVPPRVFWPVPRVDSGLVRITRHDRYCRGDLVGVCGELGVGLESGSCDGLGVDRAITVDRATVFRFVDEGFGQRRKMIRSALARLVGSGDAVEQLCRRVGVDPQARAERLTIDDFIALAREWTAMTGSGDDESSD